MLENSFFFRQSDNFMRNGALLTNQLTSSKFRIHYYCVLVWEDERKKTKDSRAGERITKSEMPCQTLRAIKFRVECENVDINWKCASYENEEFGIFFLFQMHTNTRRWVHSRRGIEVTLPRLAESSKDNNPAGNIHSIFSKDINVSVFFTPMPHAPWNWFLHKNERREKSWE